jgi:PAS domain S-box-containing protein
MPRPSPNAGNTPSVSDVSTDSVLESIPDAVVIADLDSGDVVEANDAAGNLFECRPERLVGRDHSALHPPEEPDAYREAFRRAFEEGQVDCLADGTPLYVETLAGERKPVEINARQLDADGRSLVLGVFREISDRLHHEQRLEETTARLETLLDALPLPVSVLDIDGTVELWNQAAEETFGYASGEVLGEFYPLFVDYDEFDDLLARVADGGILDGYETTHRARDGSVVDVELYARPLYEGDEISGIVGAAIDITEQKQRTQRLDVLHRVLRHNLRNRLAVIQGFATELTPNSERESEATEQILDASDSLVELAETAAETRKLVTRAQRRTETIPLAEVVATVETSVESTSVRIDAEPAQDPITVPRQSAPALDWLLAAIDDHASNPAVDVTVQAKRRYVRLTVRGDEPLLDDGARELIENGRETSLRHGNDLDIAQMYLVLMAVGGAICAPAAALAGSTIQVELPRAGAE